MKTDWTNLLHAKLFISLMDEISFRMKKNYGLNINGSKLFNLILEMALLSYQNLTKRSRKY